MFPINLICNEQLIVTTLFLNKFLFFCTLNLSLITNNFQFSKYCAYLLKFLTTTTHVIYRILTLHRTIIIGNKILFKFEDNKKQILF